jgi:mRNA interferase RelE/StbE
MTYKISFKKSVRKDVKRIPAQIMLRIDVSINNLSSNPFPTNSRKIYGYKDYYRLRVGTYRVIYQVRKKVQIIAIIKIAHRKEVYRVLR